MGANVKIAPASGLRSTTGEEIANAITHGVGAVLSLAGLVVMVALAALHSGVWQVIGCSIYASSLLILYLISTLYHSLTPARSECFKSSITAPSFCSSPALTPPFCW